MKTKLLFFTAFLSFISMQAQFGPQQIISSETDKAHFSIPFDIDNDGFMDVLSAQGENYAMVWFRNLDGLGNFGPKIVISDEPAFYLDIQFVDIDTDGDKDILFLENNPREVQWIENIDGTGTFGEEQLIASIDYIKSVRTLDFDNDGDLDLISTITNTFTDGIVWFENEDGLGNFGEPQSLINGSTEFYPPILEDIDNDGDTDILTSLESYDPSTIVWFENSGELNFTTQHIIHQFDFLISDWTSINSLAYVDIDADGIKDIVFNAYQENTGENNGWIKHIDNNGTFATPQNMLNYSGYRFYDFDNDGDNDILSTNRSNTSSEIYWVENNLVTGFFEPKRIISNEIDFIRDAQAADIDGDGLLDVVSASLGDNTVAWYKNTGILTIEENQLNKAILYPNPTNNNVYFNTSETIVSATITTILGTLVKTVARPSFVDLTELSSGIYFITVTTEAGQISVEKIIKK